ncbi:MAG TPA: group III truncated hemoglobin [Lacunisphaera sp.]
MSAPASPPDTLFVRLGGRPRLMELLRYFYADVRQHQEIAPIFAAHIEDWPAHLEKIADFWSGVTGGPAVYAGAMPLKHVSLGLEERHFQAWLGLWARHCRARLAPAEAADLIAAAETIGQRLRQIVALHAGRPKPG